MSVASIIIAILLLACWEWPPSSDGSAWDGGPSWMLMVAWAAADEMKLSLPSLPLMQTHLLDPLAKRYLTPAPNPYW